MPRSYWKDRLLKLKAVGANTLETYVPWNAHEPKPGIFDFTGNLDIRQYLDLAIELNLHVILRPGPYICSEWDFGGLPAWLLSDPNMEVRVNYPIYQEAAEKYLRKLFEEVHDYFSVYGGPIVAVQIENEYGGYTKNGPGIGQDHVNWVRSVFLKHGVEEKMFTSDGTWSFKQGRANSVDNKHFELATINFAEQKGNEKLAKLVAGQPGRPVMVMEYWTGWFDHWTKEHNHRSTEEFSRNLEQILNFTKHTNVNMYMFFGGTNFGFFNGGNTENEKEHPPYEYFSDTTSYDYDAPLSEAGHMTDKFYAARDVIAKILNKNKPSLNGLSNITLTTYADPKLIGFISLWTMLSYIPEVNVVDLHEPVAMELLPIHENKNWENGYTGQGYGYTFYQTVLDLDEEALKGGRLSIEGFRGNFRDRAHIFLSKTSVTHIDANSGRDSINGKIHSKHLQLQIMVENAGRVNYGQFLMDQRKGLFGKLTTRGKPIYNWKVFPLEFDKQFMKKLCTVGLSC